MSMVEVEIRHHKQSQSPNWHQSWCCVSSGIGRELSLMSCCRQTKRLILISTVNNW